jgi:hypothetical protein
MDFAAAVADMDARLADHVGKATVVYAPAAGGSYTLAHGGIFTEDYLFVDAGEAGVASVGPAVDIVRADLPVGVDPVTDDPTLTITWRGTTKVYKAKVVEPDSMGRLVYQLRRVS